MYGEEFKGPEVEDVLYSVVTLPDSRLGEEDEEVVGGVDCVLGVVL